MNLFELSNHNPAGSLGGLVQSIGREVNRHGNGLVPKEHAAAVISMESMDSIQTNEISTSISGLKAALESIAAEFTAASGSKVLSKAQKQAGLVAGTISADPMAFLRAPVNREMPAMEGYQFIPARGGDAMESRLSKALESYDEKETRATVQYSVAYNMQAARQDEFGEAFFPTVTITPDQVGYTVSIRLVQVMDEQRRDVSGAASRNFGKRNIIQALIDPTVLRNDQTKIIPVYTDASKSNFVDSALVAPSAIVHEGESITTSPLAIGKKFSLLGISQTEALLATGILDSTDAIDPAINLATLYLQLGSGANAEVVKFGQLQNIQASTFVYAQQGNYRQMNLHFETNAQLVNQNTTKVDGSASTILAPVVTGKYNVRLSMFVAGSVNLELADTQLSAGGVSVFEITDQDGNVLDLTSGQGATLAALFADAKLIGYDLNARRTNSNRRERGQLLDLTFFNQVYAVPLLSPITIPRPLTVGDANDASDLGALITATHIRTSNAAVAKLLEAEQVLRNFVSTNGGVQVNDAEIMGVSRYLVTPFYEFADLVMPAQTDSLSSHQRAEDIQATLVNQLRDMAYRAYRDSGYKAAADALSGGIAKTPTVIIGTDPVISRYLTVTGDFRTLGNDFEVKIVSTLNENMRGKIMMTFGEFGEGKEGVPNPMHFGNMAWKPELTLVLPLHRNGANSKELSVQPSFLHVVNLPILCSLTVEGIEEVATKKVPVNFHTV